MTKFCPHCLISRRRFLQIAAATGAVGLTGAVGYSIESTPLPAPFPEAGGQASALGSGLPAPDVPLLLLINDQAEGAFGRYLAEILRTEGLHTFREARLRDTNLAYLTNFSSIVLSEGPLDVEQSEMLAAYVTAGGNLVAMRPDPRLAPLFGVAPLGGQTTNGYLGTVAEHPITQGITPTTLQFHGPADQLRLDGAEMIARLYSDAATPTQMPLVTLHRVGKGVTALWAFDLARSIALTRQGNPDWANQERDDIEGVRSADMFVGWADTDRIDIPQADEQQRLLVNLLHSLSVTSAPLPRLAYFPSAANTVLVLTGDAHGSYVAHIEDVLSRVERYGGQMSIYYTPPPVDTARRMLRRARWWAADLPVVGAAFGPDSPFPTPKHIATWRERTHEFGLHPYVEAGLEAGYNAYWNDFVKLGYGPVSPTVRTHRILWHGWIDNARVQAQYGIRMNLDHYHIGSAVRKPGGEWAYGYLNGSGLPMKFVDENGTVLRVYQQHTHLVDEHLMNVFDTGKDVGLTGDKAVAVSQQIIQDSLHRYPAALGMQCHIDPFLLGGDKAANVGRWLEGTLEFAAAHSVPILSAEHWLAFTESRSATYISNLTWEQSFGSLAFDLAIPNGTSLGIGLMFPITHAGQVLRQVKLDNADVTHQERTVGGQHYAVVQVTAGKRRVEGVYQAL